MCMRYLWGVQAHGRPLTFVEFHESDELSLYRGELPAHALDVRRIRDSFQHPGLKCPQNKLKLGDLGWPLPHH